MCPTTLVENIPMQSGFVVLSLYCCSRGLRRSKRWWRSYIDRWRGRCIEWWRRRCIENCGYWSRWRFSNRSDRWLLTVDPDNIKEDHKITKTCVAVGRLLHFFLGLIKIHRQHWSIIKKLDHQITTLLEHLKLYNPASEKYMMMSCQITNRGHKNPQDFLFTTNQLWRSPPMRWKLISLPLYGYPMI